VTIPWQRARWSLALVILSLSLTRDVSPLLSSLDVFSLVLGSLWRQHLTHRQSEVAYLQRLGEKCTDTHRMELLRVRLIAQAGTQDEWDIYPKLS
jgi:hypothetical protein